MAQGLPAGTGTRVTVNGQRFNLPWQIQGEHIGIADYGVERNLGLVLLSNSESTLQPVQWFSDPQQTPLTLAAWMDGGYRFLDVATLAQGKGWQVKPVGTELQLSVPVGQVQNIRLGRQAWGDRIVVDLAQAATWNLVESPGEFTVVVNAVSPPAVAAAINDANQTVGQTEADREGATPSRPTLPGNLLKSLTVTPGSQQTTLRGVIPDRIRPVVSMLPQPDRLIIDIRYEDLQPRDLKWAPGLRWQQQYVAIGGRAFPTYWLEMDPRQAGLDLQPIWSDPTTATGITPLTTMAQRWQSAAAINGGFFNRNNQYPLGAIRRDRTWISGPILGRGAIAWDNDGNFLLSRLALNQSLTTGQGRKFDLQAVNSGYVQAGIGLYTPAWGPTYTPLTDGETLVSVVGDRVVSQHLAEAAGTQPWPIPPEGYLLAIRSFSTAAAALAPGTPIQLSLQALPASFDPFPHVMAAGPLLLQQGQVILNAAAEGFSSAFINQAAPRSAIGLTAQGKLLLVATHYSPNGRGPTLGEMARVMKQLGCVDALNLDGGGSSSLYIGGRLTNRDPRTAGRVHNGIGIFLAPAS